MRQARNSPTLSSPRMAQKKSSTSEAHTAPKSSKGSTAGPRSEEKPTSSGSSSADVEILEHIGRYGLTIREIVARLFFAGDVDKAGRALGRLQEQGRIHVRGRLLKNRYSYYQLTAKGCAEAGVTEERAKPIKGTALTRSLAVLWFATMSGIPRARLREDRLPAGCPPVPGKPPHVAEKTTRRVYRVHAVAEQTSHSYAFNQITEVVEELTSTKDGRDFLASGAYGFAVLVHEEAKKARCEEAMSALKKRLPTGTTVIVELAPSPNNLRQFLAAE